MCNLIHGDCREYLFTCEPDSIDLTVTSPPYDNLRTYNGSSVFGWAEFAVIAAGLWRVTRPGGVVVWVVGDATLKGSETGTSLKQALFFKECGFNLHDTMIYAKTNSVPQNHNRYEQTFEFMFVFSKGKPKTFNPIKIKTKHGGKQFNWGDRKTVMDRRQSRRHRKADIRSTKPDKISPNIFYYPVGGGNTRHPAVFPEQLAHDHIISWSNEGDTVFDPLMGSGTTGKMANQLNRNFIGIEIDKEYFEIARKRIEKAQQNQAFAA